MTDVTSALLLALGDLPACARASFEREEQPLPILTVAEENASVFAQADGEPYLEEHHLRLDAYAASAGTVPVLRVSEEPAETPEPDAPAAKGSAE